VNPQETVENIFQRARYAEAIERTVKSLWEGIALAERYPPTMADEATKAALATSIAQARADAAILGELAGAIRSGAVGPLRAPVPAECPVGTCDRPVGHPGPHSQFDGAVYPDSLRRR
jgi:predicted phosphohydrolase